MKKTIKTISSLLAASLMFLTVTGVQARTPAGKTDEFHGHWFITVQGGIGQTVGETSFGDLISPAAALNFGYRFTPVWGLRAGLSGWQAKGAIVGPTEMYRYNYLQGNVDVIVDICGIFSGYRMSRALSPYLFAGVGVNGAFNNVEAQSLASRFPADGYLWDGSKVFPGGRFGVGTGIRITDAVQFNLEVNANILGDKFNSKQGSAVDWQLGVLAGLTFNIGLGKGKSKAKSQPAVVAPVPVTVPEEKPAPEDDGQASAPAAPVPVPTPVEEAAPEQEETPVSEFRSEKRDVFFRIGRYELRESEMAKLEELAAIARENPGTVVEVTGYADPQTGSAKRNMYLSQKRAEAVAGWLETAGISKTRIKISYKGSTESPYDTPEKNRVAVCIVK